MITEIFHWLSMVIGTSAGGGDFYYLFWSGIVGDIGLFTAALAFYKHKNCHAKGCLRLGKHAVEGTPYVTCAKHHPAHPGDKAISAEEIAEAHRIANSKD